jgi:hypothetical protein
MEAWLGCYQTLCLFEYEYFAEDKSLLNTFKVGSLSLLLPGEQNN